MILKEVIDNVKCEVDDIKVYEPFDKLTGALYSHPLEILPMGVKVDNYYIADESTYNRLFTEDETDFEVAYGDKNAKILVIILKCNAIYNYFERTR